MSLQPRKCAKCPASIIMAVSAKSGGPMPVDVTPAENGNVRLRELGDNYVADVLGKEKAEAARAQGERLHVSHFATCPAAPHFRKPKAPANG